MDSIQLLLTIEHRAAAAPDPLRLQLMAGDDVDVHLSIVSTAAPADVDPPSEIDRRVLELLARAGRPLSRSQLRAELHVRNERLGDALSRLVVAGAIQRHADRWAVPVPTP